MRRRGRPPHPDILTPREWEVLALVQEGASNDEIAQRLGITERTAKYHVSEIMSKLGVSSREEAVAAIGERGVEPKLSRWALFLRIAAAFTAAAVLVGVALLAWGVLQGGDDSGVPSNITVEELYSRVLSGATRPNQILHTTFEYTGRDESGAEKQAYIGEYWLDVATDTVRGESHPGADNTDPEAGDSLSMLQGPYQYQQDSETVALRSDSTSLCPGSTSAVISVLLVCGGGPDTTRSESRIDTDADWEGHRAIAIETLLTPIGFTPETAPPVATVTPIATAGQTILTPPPNPAATSSEPGESVSRWTVFLDGGTFLPLASVYDYNLGSPDSETALVVRYEHEFIDRSELPADYFDPRSIGYGTPDSAGELSDLANEVRVYWLSEDVPASPGLPELVLERVQPATLRDAAYLWYRGPNGYPDVSVVLWQPAAGTAYLAAARNAFLDNPTCTTESQITDGQYEAHVFTLPDVSAGVPATGSCGDRLVSLQTIPPANYFSYVELGDVVVELRAFRSSEYDSTNGIQTLLEKLRPFTAGQ